LDRAWSFLENEELKTGQNKTLVKQGQSYPDCRVFTNRKRDKGSCKDFLRNP
jgi:hypothetical protein